MDEVRAHRMVDALAAYGVRARVERAGVYQFGIAIRLDGDRVAIWDSDGTAGLEAQVMRNGMLVGFVPTIPGSEDFTEAEAVRAIVATDYDAPVTRPASSSAGQAAPAPRTPPPAAPRPAPPAGGGVLRRLFRGGR
jgi:hypothetical protein